MINVFPAAKLVSPEEHFNENSNQNLPLYEDNNEPISQLESAFDWKPGSPITGEHLSSLPQRNGFMKIKRESIHLSVSEKHRCSFGSTTEKQTI